MEAIHEYHEDCFYDHNQLSKKRLECLLIRYVFNIIICFWTKYWKLQLLNVLSREKFLNHYILHESRDWCFSFQSDWFFLWVLTVKLSIAFEISLIASLLLFLFLLSQISTMDQGRPFMNSALLSNKHIYWNFRYTAMQLTTGTSHCIAEDSMTPHTLV